MIANENDAIEFSDFLMKRGFDIRAIRPPTVKESRLRISINSEAKRKDIEKLIETIKDYKKEK